MSKFRWFLLQLILRKEEKETMIMIYYSLIVEGVKKYSEIPKHLKRIRTKVKELLIRMDYEELIDEQE